MKMTSKDWLKFDHFNANEFNHPDEIRKELVEKLNYARMYAGVPFKITSSFRAEDPRSHGKGLAVDIACTKSKKRWLIVRALIVAGFTRIGIYDKHIHGDVDPDSPQNGIWIGESS